MSELHENQRFYGVSWGAPARLERPAWSDAAGCPLQLEPHLLPPATPNLWELVATPGTDAEGWQYGTVFSHLDSRRPGGRASRRLQDLVRRRVWRARQPLPASGAAAAAAQHGEPAERRQQRGQQQQQVEPPSGQQEAGGASSSSTDSSTGAAAAALGAVKAVGGGPSGAADLEAPSWAVAAVAAEGGAALGPGSTHDQAMELLRAMHASLMQRRRPWAILPWGPPAIGELRRSHQQQYAQLQAEARAGQTLFGPAAPPPRSLLRPTSRFLIEDLETAALHARAAYGYAAASGHMGSVRSYIRLHTLERLRFDPVRGVSVEANEEAVEQAAGLQPGDLLASCWQCSPLRPCYYVALDRTAQCVVLAVRGSLEHGDWLSDVCARPVPAEFSGRRGQVHAGMLESARHLLAASRGALEEAGRRVPGWPLLLAGHSLGGGVAALLALLLEEEGLPPGLGPLHCVALGPAAVLNAELAGAAEQLVTSVVVGSDVVPRLSCASVEALMAEVSLTSPGRQAVSALSSKLAQALGISQQDALKLEDFESWGALKRAGARVALSIVDAGLQGMLRSFQSWLDAPPPGEAPQEPQQLAAPAQPPNTAAATGAGAHVDAEGAAAEPAGGGFTPGLEIGADAGELSDEEITLLAELAVTDAAAAELAGTASTAGSTDQVQEPQEQGGTAARAAAAGSSGATCEAEGMKGHPEPLYPPGRILWVLDSPCEQETKMSESLAATGASAVAGAAEAVPAAAVAALTTTQPQPPSEAAAIGSHDSANPLLAAPPSSSPPPQQPQHEAPTATVVERRSFHHILLLPGMLEDHLPDRYIQALQALMVC